MPSPAHASGLGAVKGIPHDQVSHHSRKPHRIGERQLRASQEWHRTGFLENSARPSEGIRAASRYNRLDGGTACSMRKDAWQALRVAVGSAPSEGARPISWRRRAGLLTVTACHRLARRLSLPHWQHARHRAPDPSGFERRPVRDPDGRSLSGGLRRDGRAGRSGIKSGLRRKAGRTQTSGRPARERLIVPHRGRGKERLRPIPRQQPAWSRDRTVRVYGGTAETFPERPSSRPARTRR
jgi:hypothetical protein